MPELRNSLHDAVADTVKSLLAFAHIRCQAGTRKVEWIANGVGNATSQTTRQQIGAKRLPEMSLIAVLREKLLDGVVEGQRRALLGCISDAIHQISSPESSHALLRVHPFEAVAKACVPLHLARDDIWIGVLGLHQQLDAFDW